MKLLHLHPGADTGGQSAAAKRVLEAGGDEVRVFVRKPHPFKYGGADIWDDDAVRESYKWAEVVVIHNDPSLFERVDDGSEKALFVHHHGSMFRDYPKRWDEAKAIGARQIVSTVDLLLTVPPGEHADWMPQVVDTTKMQALRTACRPDQDDRIVVTHAPTNRMIKGTRYVMLAKRQLRGRADFIIIQRQPWIVCLTMKASSHVFIDQLALGYGNNAIEAWAMDLPVIAGASPAIIDKMYEVYGGSLPFLHASRETLRDRIVDLIESPELRADWAAAGRAHVRRWHEPKAWAKRARSIYQGTVTKPLTDDVS